MKTSTITNNSLIFNYGKTKVPFDSITHFKSESGNYTRVFRKGKDALISSFTLKHYVQKLTEQSAFIVPCKGLLVNKSYIEKLDRMAEGLFLVLKSGEKFKVSRRRRTEILKSCMA